MAGTNYNQRWRALCMKTPSVVSFNDHAVVHGRRAADTIGVLTLGGRSCHPSKFESCPRVAGSSEIVANCHTSAHDMS